LHTLSIVLEICSQSKAFAATDRAYVFNVMKLQTSRCKHLSLSGSERNFLVKGHIEEVSSIAFRT